MGKGDSTKLSGEGEYTTPKPSKRGKTETPKSSTQVTSGSLEKDALEGMLSHEITSAGSIPGTSPLIVARSWGPPGPNGVGDLVIPAPSEVVAASITPAPSEVDASVVPGPSEVDGSVPRERTEIVAPERQGPSKVGASVSPGPSEVDALVPPGAGEGEASVHTVSSEVCASVSSVPIVIGALVPSGPGEVDASVPPGPSEERASVPPWPSKLCTLVAPCLGEGGVSVTSCPAEVGTSEASCLVDVCVPDSIFQGEACASLSKCLSELSASVASCPPEHGTSEAPGAAEGCDLLVSAKEASLGAEGETAPSVGAAVHDAGILPGTLAHPVTEKEDTSEATVSEEGAFSQTVGCSAVEQNCSKIGATREQPSVDIFNTTVDTFLEKLVEAGSYQRFAKCYERFYKFQPEMTKSIYDQFLSQLQTSFKDEIREIKDEGNLEALLNSLDKIKDEAKSRVQPAWRPSGIPEEDLLSTLAPYYLQQKECMRRLLKEKESENAKLAESVLAGRARIAALQDQIQKRKEAWKAVSTAQRELISSLQEPKSEKLRWNL